ncbi:uncharacterized protein FRV6_16527 [Fusarium oxysporum]|uniref:Tc1-like transposase DDE domain-containing protein n=1 Tax=Fusarium oxysporum TaxID=5507 RepID=A0A2H3UEZ4_FUSOX|nr:uncharacterized protein FRV6_16527 [Fusarium oxysporum]
MVWAGIAGKKKTSLIVMTRDPEAARNGYTSWSYVKALSEGLLPFIGKFELFQQDNARIHTSKKSKDWLLLHGIRPIDWPTDTPDLNPIEHLWKALKSKLRRLHPEFTRLSRNQADTAKMVAWIKEAWDTLDPSLVEKLTQSMECRLQASVRACATEFSASSSIHPETTAPIPEDVLAKGGTGSLVKRLVEDVQPGVRLLAYSELISYREFMAIWARTLGMKLAGDRGIKQLSVEEFSKLIPGDEHTKERIIDTQRFTEEFGYDCKYLLTPMEGYVQSENWSPV